MYESEKQQAIARIAGNAPVVWQGKRKCRINGTTIHVRFCSKNPNAPGKFKFNINPTTLSADLELWICGDPSAYYLLPIELVRAMHDNPGAYQDRQYGERTIISVGIDDHRVVFASGGQSHSLLPYYGHSL